MWVVCIDEHTHQTTHTATPQKKQKLEKKSRLSQQILSRFRDMIARGTNYTMPHNKRNFTLENSKWSEIRKLDSQRLFEEAKSEC